MPIGQYVYRSMVMPTKEKTPKATITSARHGGLVQCADVIEDSASEPEPEIELKEELAAVVRAVEEQPLVNDPIDHTAESVTPCEITNPLNAEHKETFDPWLAHTYDPEKIPSLRYVFVYVTPL